MEPCLKVAYLLLPVIILSLSCRIRGTANKISKKFVPSFSIELQEHLSSDPFQRGANLSKQTRFPPSSFANPESTHRIKREEPTENSTTTIAPAKNLPTRPWLRICRGKSKYEFSANDCAGGYMFKEAFSSGTCLCGNGIWILKNEYCGSSQPIQILFANGNQCFKAQSSFRWIRYIGNPDDAQADGHFLATSFWDYVERLEKSRPSKLIPGSPIWTLVTGQKASNVYLPLEKVCYRSDWFPNGSPANGTDPPFARIGVTRIVSPLAKAYKQSHQAQILDYCPYFAKEQHTFWIYKGGMLVEHQGNTKVFPRNEDKVHGNCHLRCNNNPPAFDQIANVGNSGSNVTNILIPTDDYPTSEEESSGAAANNGTPTAGNTQGTKPKCDIEDNLESNLMTLGMLRSHNSYVMKKVASPVIAIPEYHHLQISRKLLTSRCSALNKKFVSQVHRMFRYLLNETSLTHPYHAIKSNNSFDRISNALMKCRAAKLKSEDGNRTKRGIEEENVDLSSILIGEGTDDGAWPLETLQRVRRQETTTATTASPENAPGTPEPQKEANAEPEIKFLYDYTTCPRVFHSSEYHKLNSGSGARKCNFNIPSALRYDPCKQNFVLEVVWKTILFTHYTCSRYFRIFFGDHAEYYTTMERLFNQALLEQYYKPAKSYEALQHAFRDIDLESFMADLDRCVACSRDTSQYRVWVKRPAQVQMCHTTLKNATAGAKENGIHDNSQEYEFLGRNNLELPFHSKVDQLYQCYSVWYDGLYSLPKPKIPSTCGLGLHVLGVTSKHRLD